MTQGEVKVRDTEGRQVVGYLVSRWWVRAITGMIAGMFVALCFLGLGVYMVITEQRLEVESYRRRQQAIIILDRRLKTVEGKFGIEGQPIPELGWPGKDKENDDRQAR